MQTETHHSHAVYTCMSQRHRSMTKTASVAISTHVMAYSKDLEILLTGAMRFVSLRIMSILSVHRMMDQCIHLVECYPVLMT